MTGDPKSADESGALTDVELWDDYWHGVELPSRIDPRLPFDRCFAAWLRAALAGESGEVFEVGCAPGKWLAVAHDAAGLRPSGIEYSPAGVAATRRNFALLGIEPRELIDGDFFAIEPEARFDVVLSLGFIEHFDDPAAVLDRTLGWVRPGGVLVVGVPNFRGVHGLLQRALDPKVLAAHNLAVMDPAVLTGWAASRGLAVERAGYLCGFEPALPVPDTASRSPLAIAARAVIWAARRLRRSALLDGFNGPRSSAYIAMSARRPVE